MNQFTVYCQWFMTCFLANLTRSFRPYLSPSLSANASDQQPSDSEVWLHPLVRHSKFSAIVKHKICFSAIQAFQPQASLYELHLCVRYALKG